MTDSASPRRITLFMVLITGIAAASTAAIFIRFAQADGAPSLVIAAARLTIATLLLTPYVLIRHLPDLGRLDGRSYRLALLSGIFLALHFAFWITSLEYTSVASSVVLVSTTPLWVALFAPLVVREKVGPVAILGMILALAGGGIIGFSDVCTITGSGVLCPPISVFLSGRAFIGDFLALSGAWMAAGYLLVGRRLRANLPLVPYIFIVYGMAALVLIVTCFLIGQSPQDLPGITFLWFFLLALLPQLIGHTSFNWAIKYLPASFISVTLLGEPIGSTILAYLFFQETPGILKLVGAALLLAGIWLASKNNK